MVEEIGNCDAESDHGDNILNDTHNIEFRGEDNYLSPNDEDDEEEVKADEPD